MADQYDAPNQLPPSDEPQAGDDPNDPDRPEVEEENQEDAPIGAPQQDVDATEKADEPPALGDDDDESELSDLDDQQFANFDVDAAQIEERPLGVDESNVGLLKATKRKRTEAEEAERQKKRERRREKPKRAKRRDDDDLDIGDADEARSARRKKERPRARVASPVNEEELSPEERRRRALDRAMDDALRGSKRTKRKGDGIDLEAQNDELIEGMRSRMTAAASADADDRDAGKPAMRKLKLLPEVISLLNRNTLREQIVDPDINLLEAVRFFLEPLKDGSMPAYNIQKELFAALSKLPISKDALVASGIGKVTLFYTKSPKPEPTIKRQAEKLLGEWTRPIIKRSDDYRKRNLVEAAYNPSRTRDTAPSSQSASAIARERKLAAPNLHGRARIDGGLESYTIVPRSNITAAQMNRPAGGSGDAFRRMKAAHQAKTGRR